MVDPLEKAEKAFDRARRMMADLDEHSHSGEAFADRLPYVLDLLVGVRRHLDAAVPPSGALRDWWNDQRTPQRKAFTELRHAQLKRLETSEAPRRETRTNVESGHWRGRPVNAGDTVTWVEWYFVDGHYEGRHVRDVLSEELRDLRKLIDDVRREYSAGGRPH